MKAFKAFNLAGFACLALSLVAELGAAPIPANTQFTNRPQFRIPFHYDSAELSRMGAKQIRLYISRDRGRSWEAGESVLPNAGKFAYKAQTDGEYWFLVRTVDAKNQLHPDLSVTEPGLKVIVDTTSPRLDLQLRSPAPGNVQLSWTVSDDRLDLSQLRFEYLQPGAVDWQEVSIVPKTNGQTGWKIPQGGIVAVRGTVADLAKNTTTEEVRVKVLPASQTVPRPGAPESRQPVAGPVNEPRENLALSMPDRFPTSGLGPHDDVERTEQEAAGDTTETMRRSTASLLPGSTVRGNFVSHKPDERVASTSEALPTSRPAEPQRSVPGARRRVVDSRKFQIGYNLEGVGPSGVSSVDLYITDDLGATWYHYGTDDDNVSPILVEVPGDGTYGFTLGVRSGSGLSSDPPQNGDTPGILVVVDQTAPALELLPVQQGLGQHSNRLMISWKCKDANLTDKPVTLSYSPTGQAPWIPIAGPLENTGSYVWTIGAGVASKFTLRIEARDLAGHVQTVDSAQPVVIDQARPTAKIIDIELPNPASVPR